jgi:hypothetical protein
MASLAQRIRDAPALARALVPRGLYIDPLELALTRDWLDIDGERLVLTEHPFHPGPVLLYPPERPTARKLAAGAIACADHGDIARIEAAGARIARAVPYHEYIYSARRTAELADEELAPVHRKVRRFTAGHAFTLGRTCDPRGFRQLQAAWLAAKRPQASPAHRAAMLVDVQEEIQAQDLLPRIPHTALYLAVGGRLAGYILGVPIDERHWTVAYCKALPEFPGASEFLYWRLAQEFPPESIYSAGSDLRSEALAAFKRKLGPVQVLERHFLTLDPPFLS